MPRPLLWPLVHARTKPGIKGNAGGIPPWMPQGVYFTPPTQYLTIYGVTKDSTGAVLGSCDVHLFRTEDDVEVDQVVSDATTGAYEFRGVAGGRDYYIVAYKAGSPDVAGTTVNTLIGGMPNPPAVIAATYAQTVVADGAIAHWRLGETSGTNAVDAIGGLDATYQNTPTLGAASLLAADSNTAVTLVAASLQDAERASDTGLPSGNAAWSVEVWVKTTSAAEMGLVGWGQNTAGSPAKAVQVGLLTGDLTFSSAELFHSFGSTDVDDGAPHHLVWTWDGTTMLAYLDGAQVGTGWTPGAFNVTTGIQPITLGLAGSHYFDGTLDEVAVYQAALTPAQVLNHFTVAQPYRALVKADGAVGHWRLGEATGGAADVIGASNGVYTGSPTRGVAGALISDPDKAVAFPTASDYILIADANPLDVGNVWTVEFWAKWASPGTGNNYFVSKGTAFNIFEVADQIGIDFDGSRSFTSAGAATSDGQWHHWAIARAGTGSGNTKIYKDGVQQAITEDNPGNVSSSNATDLYLGKYYGSAVGMPDATLDEVAIYPTQLSGAQILAHYHAAGY